ncbi:acyl-CoA dehydratase activase-related protein [Eubacteriales bacterium KG127]
MFYPSVFYEQKEFDKQNNSLNCPVVCEYSEVIKNNMNLNGIPIVNPFLSLNDSEKLANRLSTIFSNIKLEEIEAACTLGFRAVAESREKNIALGKKTYEELSKNNIKAIVLVGRPYHLDKEINHGIPELITSLGLGVLTPDFLLENVDIEHNLRVLDQWTYHARLYRAAKYVGQTENLELIQLNSFGCGLDAITTDQVHEILQHYNKLHTVLKIDEVSNLGAIKIRIRSLIETLNGRNTKPLEVHDCKQVILFRKEHKEKHTILIPQMAPIQFSLMSTLGSDFDFNVELMENLGQTVIDNGLKYVNNDSCYPSIFVVGQFLEALNRGKYNPDNISLMISQTGGACRASNYVALIRKALSDAGFSQIPVLALSFQGIESHPGIKLSTSQTISLGRRLIIRLQYGDLIQRCLLATRPYEEAHGQANHVKDKLIKELAANKDFSLSAFRKNVKGIIKAFSAIPTKNITKPKVGIVGEILVKYLPQANNFLIDNLEAEGAEAVLSDLTDFMMYSFKNATFKRRDLSQPLMPQLLSNLLINYIDFYRDIVRSYLKKSKYQVPEKIDTIARKASNYVSLSNQYGEGWLLTGEMIDLIDHDIRNIICVQPFGCLPNHITGKGILKSIREHYGDVNIVPIDFDASASEVNQFNRIKLMLSVAQEITIKRRKYDN